MPLRIVDRSVYHDLGCQKAGHRVRVITDIRAEVVLQREFAGVPWNLYVAVQEYDDLPGIQREHALTSSGHWRVRARDDGTLSGRKTRLKVLVGN